MSTTPLIRKALARMRRRIPFQRAFAAAEVDELGRDLEAGDTLIEVLIAIVVLGLASVAMLVAFGSALTSSSEHRTLTNISTTEKNVTQQIIAQLENGNLYASCATPTTYQTGGSNAVKFTGLPNGYTASVTGVSYWTAAYTFSTVPAQCVANGPQLITATVTNSSGGTSKVTAVVNSPVGPTPAPAGAATHLNFLTQPGGAQAGQNLVPQPVVEVLDTNNIRVTNDLSTVTLTLNASNGANLTGCAGHENAGVITFNGCSILLANTSADPSYTITASDSAPGVTPATSNPFTISVGPPAQLVFTQQPAGTITGGLAFQSQPQLTVEDVGGNVVTTDSSTAALAITNGTPASGGPGTLSGCTQTETAGVISFAGCNIDIAGSGYSLTATDGSLTATSSTFTVSVGKAAQLAFTTSPTASTGGTAFGTQPTVAIEDAGGNLVTNSGNGGSDSIQLAVSGGNGTLSCTTNPRSASGGTVTFSGCKITLGTAGSFTLSATDKSRSGVTVGTSTSFTVAGAPAQLVFNASPTASSSGTAFGTQPVIWIEDSAGDLVTTATNSVTLAVNTGTGTLSCTTNPKAGSGGIVSFSGCKITIGTQGAFTLKATATGLTQATSSTFTVAGAASKVVFSQQPSSSTGGVAFPTQPQVTVQDSSGDVVTNSTAQITLAAQGGTGTLSCTTNPLAVTNGVATFSGCAIDKAGAAYTLKATSGSFTATSTAFSIAVGPVAQIAFSTQPGNGANGAALGTQPVVAVQDAGGNTVTSATTSVVLSIASQPSSGATLTCAVNPLSATAGVASFAGCQIVGATGSYTLSAAASGLASITSNTFTLSAGAATQLAFTTQPGGGANAATWSKQPVVTVEDSGGNKVTTSTASVTLAVGQNPGGTLGCTNTTVSATAGVATFAGCKITGTAGTYTLTASATGLSSGSSSAFTITFGTATQLVFSTQPGGGPNGAAWTTQPAVSVEDVSGNLVTSSSTNVTLSIHSQPGSGATLSCTNNPVAANGGVATFAGCQISGGVGNYTLTASSSGPSLSGTSAAFAISTGAPAKLTFATSPGGGVDGSPWATQPTVSVLDSGGNLVTNATNSISLSIATQPGTGATLHCTANPVAASGGTASFTGCAITGKAGSYTLSATASGLTTAQSSTFSITVGAASQLAFTTQPGGGANAAAWTTQPVVSVQDVGGNTVSGATNSVQLALGTNPGGALSCTTNPLSASGGVASFAGCTITGVAGNYTLTASSTGLTTATSSPVAITFGAATQLAFTTQPGGGINGTAWTTQPAVTVEDTSGNVVTNASVPVVLAIGTNPGGTLNCTTNPKTPVNGVASFAGCKITGTLGTYSLVATASGLTSATSNPFVITVGAPAQLAFTTQPGGGANGSVWGTQPAVTVEDAGGNKVPTATNSVTLSIGTNPGGTLACTTNPISASAGVASFGGCKITGKTGSYTLTASASGLTSATSNSLTITFGSATQLAFTGQPGGGANGAAWSGQPAVTVEDASGNAVTTSTASITLALGTNPGGTLACSNNPLAASGGTATFAGCKITGRSGSYTLTASTTGLTGATSGAFTITFGAPTQLVLTTNPAGSVQENTAFTTQPVVTVEDANGNTVTNYNSGVSIDVNTYAAGNGGSSAGLVSGCTNPLTPTNGVATFNGCGITGTAAAGTYTLAVSSGSLTPATSTSVTIVAGSASQLVFTRQPDLSAAEGVNFTNQPQLTAEDASGNVVTSFSSKVTLSIATYTAGNGGSSQGTLGCNANSVTPTNGVATFAGCDISGTAAAGTYTLQGVVSGGTSAPSTAVSIVAGAPSKLVFTTQPATSGFSGSGTMFQTQPVVSAEDANGNLVVNDANSVSLSIASGTGTLHCTTNPVDFGGGVAAFAGCNITHSGGKTNFSLKATDSGDGGLTVTSNTFRT